MRQDWDSRALEDAERFIYTRDSAADIDDFTRSGEASYNQQIRPYLPILLDGKAVSSCKVVEIGCGIGRMTEWFARDFGLVEALDVSPVMIEGARRRLAHFKHVALHVGNGSDLAPVRDNSADLVFSFIVFQHIPSRPVIENYIRETARVLKDGGAFKFQLNGDQSPEYLAHERDTWLGETYSEQEIRAILASAGFSKIAMEGAGTQYFVITVRKGNSVAHGCHVLAGEPSAESRLLEGFGPAVHGSWRPMAEHARVRLDGPGTRLYVGLYFWPESCRHQLIVAGHSFEIKRPGYYCFECRATAGDIEISLHRPPAKQPAFRVIGLY